jgi:hypothetical protein
VRQQLRRLQPRFEQNHLVQIRRLRNRPYGRGFLDPRRGQQTGAWERAQPLARMRQMRRAISHVGAEGHESSFN